MVNEFRVNAAGWRWNEITSNPQQPVGLPQDNIDQIGNLGQSGNNPIQHFGASIGSILNQWTYTFKDVATKVHGRHTIKFGGEITRLFYLNECTGCGVPGYNFFNVWDFLNDAPHVEGPTGFNPNTGIPTTQRQDDRENIWGLFVQDDLKVRRNLTLNLGLRWSYFGPLYAKQNNMFASFPGSGADFLTGLNVKKANSWDPEKNNFGPQIGFAWNPDRWGNKVVLRGGYGLNYNQEQISISANVQGNPGLIVFPTFTQSTPTSPNPGIVYSTAGDLHEVTYAEVQSWLTIAPAWRRGFVERFQSRLNDPAFRQAIENHLTELPEWDRALHPEKYQANPPAGGNSTKQGAY